MFSLTRQERRVVLFLAAVAISGLGIGFARKLSPPAEELFTRSYRITKLNINKANVRELADTKAVSLKLARAIVAYRNDNGPFISLEDVRSVRGVGEYRYQKLKDSFFAE